MALPADVAWTLAQEARALLGRLGRIKSFALQEAMLPAANLLPETQIALEALLARGRRELQGRVGDYLRWLRGPAVRQADSEEAHRRFVFLRLRFNAVLNQFDLFNDVITQRSENETGVWLSGLDLVAADALHLPGGFYQAPPVICYLDRGIGAAIRRARTRLPGGGENPVAVIRVPRERMIGYGIASSLIHEVGHQAAALLDLVNSLRPLLRGMQRAPGAGRTAWQLWERWISEIVADFWSVARVGIASTCGLMGVVGLPRPFVFRVEVNDPHPAPWVRVKVSCAMGRALYPHPQWDRLEALWDAYYPLRGLDPEHAALLQTLAAHIPALVALLINHRPRSLRGRSLIEVMQVAERQPALLAAAFGRWQRQPALMSQASPCLVFAVFGQARADGRLTPEREGELLGRLLTHWALNSTLTVASACARRRHATPSNQPPLLSLRSGG